MSDQFTTAEGEGDGMNLRSDCLGLIRGLPAGNVWKVHIEALCHQIDDLEEKWHSAERKAQGLENELKAIKDAIEEEAEFQESGGLSSQ